MTQQESHRHQMPRPRRHSQRAVDKLGGLDILVNNAAHQATFKNVGDISDDEWRMTFEVNIHAMFYLSQAAVPYMKPGGAIINTRLPSIQTYPIRFCSPTLLLHSEFNLRLDAEACRKKNRAAMVTVPKADQSRGAVAIGYQVWPKMNPGGRMALIANSWSTRWSNFQSLNEFTCDLGEDCRLDAKPFISRGSETHGSR